MQRRDVLSLTVLAAWAALGLQAATAAPAAAPFRNLRRLMTSFLDFRMVVYPLLSDRFLSISFRQVSPQYASRLRESSLPRPR